MDVSYLIMRASYIFPIRNALTTFVSKLGNPQNNVNNYYYSTECEGKMLSPNLNRAMLRLGVLTSQRCHLIILTN